MVRSFARLIDSAYNIQREQGLIELLKESYHYTLENSYYRILYDRKDTVDLECDGVRVRFDTSSDISKNWFFPRYLDGTLHEPEITRELIKSLNSDSVFYDVGANVGYYTVFAAEVCTRGEVHAFDINPQFLQLAEKSLDANGVTARLNNVAISNSTGETVSYSGEFGTTSVDSDSDDNSCEVDTITIDDYIKENQTPDVMKIDVEGFESHVLEGAGELLRQGYPKKLFLEIHPSKIRDYGRDVREVINRIESYGYSYDTIGDHRNQSVKVENFEENLQDAGNTMLICEK